MRRTDKVFFARTVRLCYTAHRHGEAAKIKMNNQT
jgi:hypothetical protein